MPINEVLSKTGALSGWDGRLPWVRLINGCLSKEAGETFNQETLDYLCRNGVAEVGKKPCDESCVADARTLPRTDLQYPTNLRGWRDYVGR